jgi:hypothetical protein
MICPKCNKETICGCASCQQRKGMPKQRSARFKGHDDIVCPYCRTVFNYWYWEEYNMKLEYKNNNNTNS